MQPSVRRRLARVAILAALAVPLAGCRTAGRSGPPPVAGGVGDVLPPVVQPAEVGAAELAVQSLNVAVVSRGADRDGAAIAERIAKNVADGLVARQFTLDASRPDLEVKLAVDAKRFDAFGNYRLYQGEIDIDVLKKHGARRVGGRKFAAKGDRALGDPDALASLADKLAADAAAYVAETCTAGAVGVRAVNLAVDRAWRPGRDSQYAKQFVNLVGGIDGVFACHLVEQDHAARRMTFRIVFDDAKFPDGILNRLANTRELNFKPRN